MSKNDKAETSVSDVDGNPIWTGDNVSLFGMIGEVVFESGAYGIGFEQIIDWGRIEKEIFPITGCNNAPYFCYNDNFISFWELLWNFNCEDDWCVVVKIVDTGKEENHG